MHAAMSIPPMAKLNAMHLAPTAMESERRPSEEAGRLSKTMRTTSIRRNEWDYYVVVKLECIPHEQRVLTEWKTNMSNRCPNAMKLMEWRRMDTLGLEGGHLHEEMALDAEPPCSTEEWQRYANMLNEFYKRESYLKTVDNAVSKKLRELLRPHYEASTLERMNDFATPYRPFAGLFPHLGATESSAPAIDWDADAEEAVYINA